MRINDRGPFHAGRVIDLSYAAAHKLGYIEAGSAQVEVEAMRPGQTRGLIIRRFSCSRMRFLLSFSLFCVARRRPPRRSRPRSIGRSWMVGDLSSGQILAAQKADERVEPASLTKLMTAYVVFAALREQEARARPAGHRLGARLEARRARACSSSRASR